MTASRRDAGTAGARLEWADFARGAAILCVVYFHATLFLNPIGIDQTLGRAKAVFELFPLPAFFILAGVFSARGVREWSFGTLLKRRVAPLLYMYVLWSVARFVMFAAAPAIPARDTDIPASDPVSLLLLPVLPASLYWFLFALALFEIVAWLVRRAPRWLVVSVAAVLSTAFTSGLLNTSTIAWNRIGALLVFFVVGAFYSAEIRSAVATYTPIRLVIALVAFGAVAGALAFYRPATGIPFAVLVAQCLAVWAAFLASVPLAKLRGLRFVRESGRASLPIYLVHLFAIAPLAWLLSLLSPDWNALVNILVTVGVSAIAVLCGFGLARLARFAPWLLAPVLRRPQNQPTSASAAVR